MREQEYVVRIKVQYSDTYEETLSTKDVVNWVKEMCEVPDDGQLDESTYKYQMVDVMEEGQ